MNQNPRRSLAAILAAAAMAATPIVVAGCGDDASEAVDGATSGAGEAVEGATSAADDAIEGATSSAKDVVPADDSSTGAVVVIPAAEGLKFAKTAVTVKAGKVTLRMPNPTSVPHNIALDLNNADDEMGKVVEKGGVSEISADLEPPKYEYYCSVPGHREAGMVGTLTVK